MPTDVVERVHATPNSGVEQRRNYRVGVWIPPSGSDSSGRLLSHRYYVVLAAPAQSPTGSEIGRQIEGYVERYLSRNLELASTPAKPAGVSSSPLARAATMSPWDAKNRRRIRLIEKKYAGGLDGREADELKRLKREVAAHMEVVAPRAGDVLDEQAARLEEVEVEESPGEKRQDRLMPPPEPYAFPPRPHVRRHGPDGYPEYGRFKDWLRDEFQFRCAYCLYREIWERRGWRRFEIDHIEPQTLAPHRVVEYDNLAYACDACNNFKRDEIIPGPCDIDYSAHFRFVDDGTIEALTLKGEYLIEILGLDSDYLERSRRKIFRNYRTILELIEEYGEDDEDVQVELRELLGYPDDVPNLKRKKPPGNSRPDGKDDCYYVKLKDPAFPRLY